MVDLDALRADLGAEHDELDRLVAGLGAEDWDIDSASPGWTIRDQITHLNFFDDQAVLAVTDPDGFAAGLAEAAGDIEVFIKRPLEDAHDVPVDDVLGKWRSSRGRMLDAFATLGAKDRISWFGPPMSAASFISARLMETWAHGQDVWDALGRSRTPTDRLKHIAFLGVRARGYSYTANGMTQPDGEVAVELDAPSGARWVWNEGAGEKIAGSALGFCLVVTRRRHPDDTDLVATGSSAREWLSIAQCFAGPGGEGRRPGQFTDPR